MAVRWPDGSVTGSVLVKPAPTPVEPEPEETKESKDSSSKEVKDAAR